MNVSRLIIVSLVVATVSVVAAFGLSSGGDKDKNATEDNRGPEIKSSTKTETSGTTREIKVTAGEKHTIPLEEILSGGPPKDGIPSIDDPSFTSIKVADEWLENDAPGIGLAVAGEVRFYPYAILVWHEIVNDEVAGRPIAVTYCPLCGTGIVFDRQVAGEVYEFGVSGKLWQSNLLMYNRTGNSETETLFSQVLGAGVVGPLAGEALEIVPSSILRYESWKEAHPDTVVLSRDTGSGRDYDRDPYAGYYESDRVSFGASFDDERLDPKQLVYGIEVDGQYKAYEANMLPVGTTTDEFSGQKITIEKTAAGEVAMFTQPGNRQLSIVTGFWFSWAAVHPDTALFK